MANAQPIRHRLYKWPVLDSGNTRAVISLDDVEAPSLAEFPLESVNHSAQIHEMLHLVTFMGGTNAEVLEDGTARMPDGQYESIIGITFDLEEPFSPD